MQENTLYDLDFGVKVTQNVAEYRPHHMTYAPSKFEVKSNGLGGDTFTRKYICDIDLRVKVAQYPPHHVIYAVIKFEVAMSNRLEGYALVAHYVTYAPAKFEVAMSYSLGGDASTRKYIIWPWPQGQGHELLPRTLYMMWSMHLQSLNLLCPMV